MGVGLHVIFQSQDGVPEVDVVAVHGLNFKNRPDHGVETWTKGESLWLRDFLPRALEKPCRVMLFEYNSSPAFGASAINLDDHAASLLNWLDIERKISPRRPLIFICHSLGGLVAKQALVQAKLDDTHKSVLDSTRLLVFFATPHQGGNYASVGDIAAKILLTAQLKPSHDLLDALKRNSNEATRRAEQARHIYERCLVVSFFEGQSYGNAGIIVDQKSAALNLPGSREKQVKMDSDHSSICKFDSADSPLCRLALGIIKAEFERSLSLGTINTHWLVPASVNSLFTGRSEVVKRIKNALLPETTFSVQKRFVLTGMAGQGKSEVCLKVVNELRDLFWGIFWVDVSNESTATAGFTRIADMLGLRTKDIENTCLKMANSKPEQGWLLVLDNADDPDTDYQRYFPSGIRGMVLLTSRISSCNLYETVGSEELHSLSEQDSTALLLKGSEISESAWPEQIAAAKVVVNILGSHTLALLQAAAYITSGHCSLSEYPNHFRKQQKRLLEHSSKQARSRYGNVYATFEASVQVLKPFNAENRPDSLIFLELLSAFHHENVPLDLFEAAWNGVQDAQKTSPENENINYLSPWHVNQLPAFLMSQNSSWDPYRLNSAISQLESLALVKRHMTRGCFTITMHPLVHSWIGIRIQQEQTGTLPYLKMGACIIALSYYVHQDWKPFRQHLGPHLDILLRDKENLISIRDHSTHMLQVFKQIIWLLEYQRDYQKCEELLHWVFQQLNADPESPNEKHLDLYNLASIHLLETGNTKKAVGLFQEIVRIKERTCDVDNQNLSTFKYNLALALLADGQNKRAIELIEHVQKIEENLDPYNPRRLSSQYRLARAFLADGQTKKAIDLFQSVVTIQETSLDPSHPDRLASEHELARAFLADGQTEEAIDLFQSVVTIQETSLDPSHPNRLASEQELARAFLEDGQIDKAIDLFQYVATIREKSVDPNHPDRLCTERWLAYARAVHSKANNADPKYEEPGNSSRTPNRFKRLVQRFR